MRGSCETRTKSRSQDGYQQDNYSVHYHDPSHTNHRGHCQQVQIDKFGRKAAEGDDLVMDSRRLVPKALGHDSILVIISKL